MKTTLIRWTMALAVSCLGTTARGQVGADPPTPEEFYTLHADDQVSPVAHFATVSDSVGGTHSIVTDDAAPAAALAPAAPIGGAAPAYRAGCAAPGCAAPGCAAPSCASAPGCTDSGCASGCGGGCAQAPFLGCLDGVGLCDVGCGDCLPCCPPPVWMHTHQVFGEVLIMRPRDAEIAYAVPINGPIQGPPENNPIQVAGLGIVDPDYQAGYRTGFQFALTECSSVRVTYTQLETNTSDSINTEPGSILRSLVAHPSSSSAASDFLQARATNDVDFEFLDATYRRVWCRGDLHVVNYSVGGRYGKLVQDFRSLFVNNGTETVTTDVDFEGGGLLLGFDAERYGCGRQWSVYSRGSASFLAGEFEARYFQGQSFDPVVADTNWQAGRIVTVLDMEAGVGWASAGGKVHVHAGYAVNAWFNSVRANRFIEGVRQNHFIDLENTVTFDGFVFRAEYRF